MRFFSFLVFVLVSSKVAEASVLYDKDTKDILTKGEIVASFWSANQSTHITRVIYKGTYWSCMTTDQADHLIAVCRTFKSR